MTAQQLLREIERKLDDPNGSVRKRLASAQAEAGVGISPAPLPATTPDRQRLTPGKTYAFFLDRFVRAGAFLIIAIGVSVILGWFMDIALLKSVLPGLATMKMNTALGFLAAGVSLWLIYFSPPGSRSVYAARALAIFLSMLGAITLAQDLFNLHLGIDELVIRDDYLAIDSPSPGRMAPATAFNFFFIGIALLCLKARRPGLAVCTHWIVVPPLFVATLAAVGYTYGVDDLYRVGLYTSMALHTTVSFFVLALLLLAADTEYGFAHIASSDTVGGVVSRRLLPTLPVMLFLLGWVPLKGEHAGLYEHNFGLALMVLLSIVVCVIAVASTAIMLHKIDLTRLGAESEIRSLNEGLELRVQERTKQLDQLSAELKVLNKSLERLSLHDGLTDLANRRFFDRYLDKQIAGARRHKRMLALVLCDIDAFKTYNDHYGHQAGDACLKRVAGAISSCCRRPFDMVARYGGEEFAIILPDSDLNGAIVIAESARHAVAELNIPHEHSPASPCISISGGVAALRIDDFSRAAQLITAADEYLYEAKRSGRNRIVPMKAEAADPQRQARRRQQA